MKMYKIIDYCKDIEDNMLYDHQSISHYYTISYNNNKVTISLLNTDTYNNTKIQEKKVINNITLKEFTNFVINVYELKLRSKQYSNIELENIIDKITIKTIK